MQNDVTDGEPDWDASLSVTLTPRMLIHSLFSTANSAHTGWISCIDDAFSQGNLITLDEATGNYCRLVEQEYMEDDNDEVVWHDWTVELCLGKAFITGHWQLQASIMSPMGWEWHSKEAAKSFEKACTLFGRRIRRGIDLEELSSDSQPPRQRRH